MITVEECIASGYQPEAKLKRLLHSNCVSYPGLIGKELKRLLYILQNRSKISAACDKLPNTYNSFPHTDDDVAIKMPSQLQKTCSEAAVKCCSNVLIVAF